MSWLDRFAYENPLEKEVRNLKETIQKLKSDLYDEKRCCEMYKRDASTAKWEKQDLEKENRLLKEKIQSLEKTIKDLKKDASKYSIFD